MTLHTAAMALVCALLLSGMSVPAPSLAQAAGEPSPDSAEDGAGEADSHNAAFEAGLQWRVTPQTTDERLVCAAVWNRWSYAVESAASEKFRAALRPELSVANAGTREAFWRAEAARLLDSASEVFALGEEEAAAEQKADALYAAYARGEDRGLDKLMEWLAICK